MTPCAAGRSSSSMLTKTALAPGLARVQSLGLTADIFAVPGTSEDAALLLAYEHGADLIVAVGTHSNLEDFLDKGRAGMASTFLVRLKVGPRLVDARGVFKLYQPRPPFMAFVALLLSFLFRGHYAAALSRRCGRIWPPCFISGGGSMFTNAVLCLMPATISFISSPFF